MKDLTDENLLASYTMALKLSLDIDFILILEIEIKRRGLLLFNDIFIGNRDNEIYQRWYSHYWQVKNTLYFKNPRRDEFFSTFYYDDNQK